MTLRDDFCIFGDRMADASASARSIKSPIVIPILSVCLSVRPSVTLLSSAKTVRDSALVTMGS